MKKKCLYRKRYLLIKNSKAKNVNYFFCNTKAYRNITEEIFFYLIFYVPLFIISFIYILMKHISLVLSILNLVNNGNET